MSGLTLRGVYALGRWFRPAAAYKEIEDRAVDQAIAMQEGVGLDVVTDGELRRHTFIDQLTEQVEGLTHDSGDSGHIPVPFHDEAGQLKSVFTIPLSVTDKLRRRRMMTVEEYAYARARRPASGQGDAAEPADAVPRLVAPSAHGTRTATRSTYSATVCG